MDRPDPITISRADAIEILGLLEAFQATDPELEDDRAADRIRGDLVEKLYPNA